MAVDPVAPVQPTPTILPTSTGQGYSDAAVKQLRDYANALKEKAPQMKFYTWANALDDVARSLTGANLINRANQMERQTLDKTGANYAGPALSGTPQTDAAPGGAASTTPFQERRVGSAPSSTSTRLASLEAGGKEIANDAEGPSAAAMRLSSKGETGKNGIAALFNISPDTSNSKSYGPFGLNSKSGSVQQFAKGHPELGLTAEPGTPEFDEQWRKAAATNSEGMNKAHQDWHEKNIMGGLTDSMIKAGVNPAIANDPRVQTYMADRKVQMGGAGLNTALVYGRLSSSPEEFIRRVSQVDKERIPYNFQTYLRDHPNDARGLANRIDLRHSTALAGTDPDLTASMIDYHRTKNGAGSVLAQSIPPTQLAQNGPVPSYIQPQPSLPGEPLPQGRFQAEMGQLVRNLMVGGQRTLPQAMEAAGQIMKMRAASMPQYGEPNVLGMGYMTEPGRPPQPYLVPGFPGEIGAFGKTGTLKTRTFIDPVTKQPRYEILAPALPEAPATPSPVTPAVPPPPAVPPATAAPTGATAKPATRTPLERQASLGDVVFGAATGTSQVAPEAAPSAAPASEFGTQGFDTKDPIEAKALEYVNQADKESRSLPPLTIGKMGAPNELDLIRRGDITGLMQNPENVEAYKEALGKRLVNQANDYAKFETSYRDATKQAVNLAPGLKEAREIIPNKEFMSGPLHQPLTTITGVREQGGNLFRSFERDANERAAAARAAGDNVKAAGYESDAGYYKRAADWALNTKFTPTSNQIFSKILAATTLQSLRGMLGPNSGQFRQYEMQLMREALGNESMTPEALGVVLTMADKMNDRNILLGKMAAQYAAVHGGLDPTFEKYIDLFEKNNPPYTHKELMNAITQVRTSRAGGGGAGASEAPAGVIGTPPPSASTSRQQRALETLKKKFPDKYK